MSERSGPPAVVFFARDFLALEFARLARDFAAFARIYIVASEAERATITGLDPDGTVMRLGDPRYQGSPAPLDSEINRDRFLRFMPADEIGAIMRTVAGIADTILAGHEVAYYLDEPVSGYPNAEFNRRFREAGATALHFQTSWIPGYSFFAADAAQAEPIALDLLKGGRDVVRDHVAARRAGRGRPLYVIGYGRISKRLTDIATTIGKMAYRRTMRRNAAYIDRDISSHRQHVRSLTRSLAGRRYGDDPVAKGGRYVVFPLHYEPESVLAYFSRYQRQEEIAAQLLDTLPADWKLILKEHPSQPGSLRLPKWADLRQADRVVALPGAYAASNLLAMRPVVVSIGSTFALEAGLAGCPVGLLGDVHFAGAPGIEHLDDPRDWHRLIDRPGASEDAVLDWYGRFVDTYCFRGNIMRGQTHFEDMPGIVAALERGRAIDRPVMRKAGAR